MSRAAPEVRPVIGRMEDVDGVPVVLSINDDRTVRVEIGSPGGIFGYGNADLDKDAREQFMRLWCEAERQAEASVPP